MADGYKYSGEIQTFTAPTGGVVAGKFYHTEGLVHVALVTAAAGDDYAGQIVGDWPCTFSAVTVARKRGFPMFYVHTGTHKGTWTDETVAGVLQAGYLAEDVAANATVGRIILNGFAVAAET